MIASHFREMSETLLPAKQLHLWDKPTLLHLSAVTRHTCIRLAQRALVGTSSAKGLLHWKEDPDGFSSARIACRQELADLCLGEAVTQKGQYIPQIAEHVYALLCEPSWNRAGQKQLPFVQESPDVLCAQTGELLTWVLLLWKDELNTFVPGLAEGVLEAIEDRILSIMLTPSFCESVLRTKAALVFARAATVICLFLAQDESYRLLRLKNALRIADRCMQSQWLQSAFRNEGLRGWMREACALSDLAFLCDSACEGESGLCSDPDIADQLALPAQLHIAKGYFADEKCAMRPGIRGEDLYRIGVTFDIDEMYTLGVLLDAEGTEDVEDDAHSSENGNITARLLNALWRQSLESEPRKGKEAPLCRVPQLHYIASRPSTEGFFAALYGGVPVLFWQSTPVLVLSPNASSMPRIGGVLPVRMQTSDVTIKTEAYPSFSMNLVGSYPQRALLSSWQRTMLITEAATRVQLIDVFDFAGAQREAELCFVCRERPILTSSGDAAFLADVTISWQGPGKAHIEPTTTADGSDCYCLILSVDKPAMGACWTTAFTHSRK